MLGPAQKLFIEKTGKSPWISSKTPSLILWPFLERMLNEQRIAYVDYALAQQLHKNSPNLSEEVAALICHLSLAIRQGHLCIKIDNSTLFPSVEDLWINEDNKIPYQQATSDDRRLKTMILNALKQLPENLLTQMDHPQVKANTPLCCWKNHYYLQRYWMLESLFLNFFNPFFASQPTITPDLETIAITADNLAKNQQLLPEQAQAIKSASQQAFSIIIGGPGTGKTYTAGIFLRLFWQNLTPIQRSNFQIAFAAPTGKATANLENSIKEAIKNDPSFPEIKAQTLHTLLNIKKSHQVSNNILLNHDLILVDESSMIDAQMMGLLLKALKPGARLILLGDCYQLPPVETGSFFNDLVSHFQTEIHLKNHLLELKKCLRTDLQTIIQLAECVKQGKPADFFALIHENDSSVKHRSFNVNDKEFQRQLIAFALPRFPFVDDIPKSPLKLIHEFSNFRILTPMRRGLIGSEELNRLFHHHYLLKVANKEIFVVPIMITSNHHRLELFNGQNGLLIKHPNNPEKDFAYFASKEGDERKISAFRLPHFEYAYCISIHKSQGSEFNHVLIALASGAEFFGREALYTGITRAKQTVEIWGDPEVITKTIDHKTMRHSGIQARLKK